MTDLVVVKVGGSLYDIADLGSKLSAYVQTVDAAKVLLVPGGGPTADAIRTLDRTHHLGDEAAHDLALRALTLNAFFLAERLRVVATSGSLVSSQAGRLWLRQDGVHLLDAHAFCSADGTLPATWDVTSDSVAARAALVFGAGRLVLLKSVSRPPGAWRRAIEEGVVDPLFLSTLSRGTMRMPRKPRVEIVNFRSWTVPS